MASMLADSVQILRDLTCGWQVVTPNPFSFPDEQKVILSRLTLNPTFGSENPM